MSDDISPYQVINFVLCLFIFIPPLIILLTLKGKKPYKVKEDVLFIEKQLLKCLIASIYLLLILFELLKFGENHGENKPNNENDESIKILSKIKLFCFNIYIVLLFMNNFFLCIEDYFTYINPNHYFNSLINRSKYNILYETLSISIAAMLSIFYIYSQEDIIIEYKDEDILINVNKESPFIIINLLKLILILVLNIIIIILYIVLRLKLKKIIFKAREKLFRVFRRKIISTISYIIFIIFNIVLFFLEKNNKNENQINGNIKIMRIINSFLFILVYTIDIFLEFKTYSTSKFTQYKLKYTIVESIGNLLNRNKEEDEPTNTFLESMLQERSHNNSKNNISIDDEDEDDNSLLMPNNSNDTELVLIYRNNIFIEDYFFYYYDFMINLTLSSLFNIYKNKKFSPSALNNNQLNNELNITESAIFGGEKTNTFISNYSLRKIETNEEDNTTSKTNSKFDEFEFVRNSQKNDFFYAEEIFTSTGNDFTCDDIKVKITSYFTAKCVSNLLEKNITSKIISDSLKSHLSDTNNNGNENKKAKINKNNISSDINNYLPYHSILSCNAKEEFFLHLRNMSIKTFDKQLTFDIFESNDDDINIEINNSNKKIAVMLDKYFNYIKGVGVSGTFLPIVLGVFKVKINSFKTMLIYITCNSLIENSPSNNYSYWQLIRFSSKDAKKVSSSKYRHNVLIGDDLLFDRRFALPSIKEDNNNSSYNTIEMKNHLNFEETIKHDITFLNKCQIKNTNLLMMYFEYENAQKHELGGAIKIRKGEGGKAEIINTTVMPIFKDDDESDENLYIGDFSKKQDSEVATIPTIPENDKKIQSDASNRISVASNINIEDNKKENENKYKNDDNKEEKKDNENINDNLDIDLSKSVRNKESNKDLKKTVTSNSRFQSICGSLSNVDFFEDPMMSFDDANIPKNVGVQNHHMLNYAEKIKINSYDGYFDSFNCMCLFSFENIFDRSGCCCKSFNYNQLQNNILKNFSYYTPRKHTVVTKSKSTKN